MATAQRTSLAIGAPSITMPEKRQIVEDEIRSIGRNATFLLSNVAKGFVPEDTGFLAAPGKITKKNIGKKPAKGLRIEAFTFDPPLREITVTVQSTLTLTFSAADYLNVCRQQIWRNETTGVIGCVDSIGTPAYSAVFVTFGGTTFSAAVGDKLQLLGSAYPDSYDEVFYVQKEVDEWYNIMWTPAQAFEVGTLKGGAEHFNSSYIDKLKKLHFESFMNAVENGLFFMEKAAANNVTVMTAGSVHHGDGLWKLAKDTIDCDGTFNEDTILRVIPAQMPTCCPIGTEWTCFLSEEQYDKAVTFIQDRLWITKTGENQEANAYSSRFITSRGPITLVPHPVFNSYADKGIILPLEFLNYCYYANEDWHVRENVQHNEKWGKKDIVQATICLQPEYAGYEIYRIENLPTGV
jgi:hypothetical protein